jgi:ribosome-binding protein aMBF1 (putative translation factor)
MDYQAWRDEQLANDPELRHAYEELEPEYAFRNALTRARLERGLTQAEVAQYTGMQRSAVARLESGDANPTLATLERLAKGLGISFEITPTRGIQIHVPTAVH